MTKKTATASQREPELLPMQDQHSVVQKSRALTAPKAPTPINMLTVIANAAANKNVDASKMRELLDMQKEIMAEEARIEFNRAFIAMAPELPEIERDGKIVIHDKEKKKIIQSTPYATYNEINRVCRPILHKHGFALAASTSAGQDGRLNVTVTLSHVAGHEKSTLFPLPLDTSGSKNNVQGVGSSQSYARRYGAIGLLNLINRLPSDQDNDGYSRGKTIDATANKGATADQGGDHQSGDGFPGDTPIEPTTISQQQEDELRDAIEDCTIGLKRFCEHYQIAMVGARPAKMFQEAMHACAEHKGRVQEAARRAQEARK